MHTVPVALSAVTTALGTGALFGKLTFEVAGRVPSHGHTVRNPPADAPTAVTLSTADFAVALMPPRPATGTVTTPPTANGPAPAPTPSIVGELARVSSSRAGLANAFTLESGRTLNTSTTRSAARWL